MIPTFLADRSVIFVRFYLYADVRHHRRSDIYRKWDSPSWLLDALIRTRTILLERMFLSYRYCVKNETYYYIALVVDAHDAID